MAITFDHNGNSYSTYSIALEGDNYVSFDKVDEVCLNNLCNCSGEVYIPKYAEFNGKKYKVTSIWHPDVPVYRTYNVNADDRRKKPVYTSYLDYNSRSNIRGKKRGDKYDGWFMWGAEKEEQITSIILPDSITWIGKDAFANFVALKKVVFSSAVTRIASCAFINCIELEELTIPESVVSIDPSAFRGCVKIKNIIIPDSVQNIMQWAFKGCSGLTSVTIGSGITTIGEKAFADCDNLTEVNIYADPFEVMISPSAFPPTAKVNYLGKNVVKPQPKEAKAEPASSPTIDLEKLIEAALVDGTVTEKERAILCKKVKSAGGDVDEFELLLDARIYEAQQNSKKAESTAAEPKSEPIKEVIKSPKDSKPDVAPTASSATGEILWVENIWTPLKEILAKMSDIKGSKPSDKNYTTYKIKSIDAQLIVWYTEKTNEAGVALETLGGEAVKTVIEDIIAKSPAGSAVREAKLSQGKKNKDKWSWAIVTNIDVNDSNLVQWYADNILAFYSLIENK